ncbi:ground-like domain protein [Cooperia oncophora]
MRKLGVVSSITQNHIAAGGPGVTSEPEEGGTSTQDLMAEEDDLITATSIGGFHVGGNRSLGSIIDREEQDFPSGTVCDRESRESRIGEVCCNSALFETMADAFYELSSSPTFGFTAAGSIASLIQKRAQNRFDQSFEVFVSQDNFAIASYGVGDEICKYRERGFVALAYATPVQYDISRYADEKTLGVSSRDNLGATETSLPGQRSKCSAYILTKWMQSITLRYQRAPSFDPYNTRFLARTMQYAIEERLQLSFEIVVSTDDFAMAHST